MRSSGLLNSHEQPNFVSEEIEYILGEFGDLETSKLLQITVLGTNPTDVEAEHLHSALLDGQWPIARAILKRISLSTELLDEHVCKEIMWEDGVSLEVVEYAGLQQLEPASIANITAAYLEVNPKSPAEYRSELFQKLVRRPHLTRRLQDLLDSALQFKDVCHQGKLGTKPNACLRSFVYCDIYLNWLHDRSAMNCLERLERLCSKVRIINEFNQPKISENLYMLLMQCREVDEYATLKLLQQNPDFSRSVKLNLGWDPLSSSEFTKRASSFCYLKEYENVRQNSLPFVNNIFELGYVMEVIKDPKALSVPTGLHKKSLTEPYERKSSLGFRNSTKIVCKSEVWSIASHHTGCLIAIGLSSPGTVYVYSKKKEGSWSLFHMYEGSQSCERLAFDQGYDRLLISRGGSIEVVSLHGLHPMYKLAGETKNTSYGCICWHPTDREKFFAVRDSGTSLGLYGQLETVPVKQWDLPFTPSIIVPSGEHIVILTEKVSQRTQRVLLLDYTTSNLTEMKLPRLKADGTYSTLECSQWDPRVILLMSSPNRIFLLDKLGQRPTRVIYGPKVKNCMIKARFCGPMDKFIITSSEERRHPRAYVYDRFTGELASTLEGHEDQINDVEWIPSSPPCLATASDDNTVIIRTSL